MSHRGSTLSTEFSPSMNGGKVSCVSTMNTYLCTEVNSGERLDLCCCGNFRTLHCRAEFGKNDLPFSHHHHGVLGTFRVHRGCNVFKDEMSLPTEAWGRYRRCESLQTARHPSIQTSDASHPVLSRVQQPFCACCDAQNSYSAHGARPVLRIHATTRGGNTVFAHLA